MEPDDQMVGSRAGGLILEDIPPSTSPPQLPTPVRGRAAGQQGRMGIPAQLLQLEALSRGDRSSGQYHSLPQGACSDQPVVRSKKSDPTTGPEGTLPRSQS